MRRMINIIPYIIFGINRRVDQPERSFQYSFQLPFNPLAPLEIIQSWNAKFPQKRGQFSTREKYEMNIEGGERDNDLRFLYIIIGV